MGNQRVGTLLIGLGGFGLAVGSILGGSSVRMALIVAPLVVGLAVWHFRRFGLGKLLIVPPVTYVGVMASLFDPGSGPSAWDRELSNVQLVGVWLIGASGVAVLIGAVWSYFVERPAGSKTVWSYVFGAGRGGDVEPPQLGIDVTEGQAPPDGWWQASDGRWYPPETDPRT